MVEIEKFLAHYSVTINYQVGSNMLKSIACVDCFIFIC